MAMEMSAPVAGRVGKDLSNGLRIHVIRPRKTSNATTAMTSVKVDVHIIQHVSPKREEESPPCRPPKPICIQ